ncbi:MAG: ABC transporter substrate-binding protein [Clostridiales bacterium]|jgi:peptide/nickel transport system substrate-binding protein|nr:ABC transporter substrate-binding protein [Clostridiales bacterium]
MKRTFITIIAIMAAVLVFAACGRRADPGVLGFSVPDGHPLEQLEYLLESFDQYFDTGDAHVPGTTFMFGIASTAPIQGRFGGAIFTDQVVDQHIATLLGTASSLIPLNEYHMLGQHGVATFEYDISARTFVMTMQYDVYWHDGVPLTLDDVVFALEMIGHPDYAGLRRTDEIFTISGFSDFVEGRANHISGLVLSNNNRTLTFHLDEMPSTLLYGALWTQPMPRHIFQDIPMEGMIASDPVRVNPIGWGPFMIDHIVEGDSVRLVRNPNYVFGMPQIEYLVVERFHPDHAGEVMAAGRFDYVPLFPAHLYGYFANPTNFRFLGSPSNHYTYLAFRLGNWDFDTNRNVYNPNRLMAQAGPALRQAMAYASDELLFGQTFTHGLRFPASSIAPPNHLRLVDLDMPGFTYNPDRARQILDDAGFVDIDGDGFREMPDGSPLVIQWALADGPLTEYFYTFYTQAWREVGLNVQMWLGRAHDQLYLWDTLDFDTYYDNPDYPVEVHIYTGTWQTGSNPNPEGTWGHIFWNASRYTSPAYDAILARIPSEAAWDADYMQEIFNDWQRYWYENVPAIPWTWTIDLHAVNNRVTNWDTRVGRGFSGSLHGWQDIGLSAPTPYGN